MTKIQPLLTWRGALCDSGLKPVTRHVGLTLSLYMSERGDSAYPGARRLAHDTGLTERSVRDHLAILVDAGWLALVEKGGKIGERRHANVYAARVPETQLPLDQGTAFTGEGDSRVKENASTPEPHDTAPRNDVHPNSSVQLSTNSPSRSVEWSSRVDVALALLIERDVERGKPDDKRKYRVRCEQTRRKDGTLGILNQLAGEHPEWSDVELADQCEGLERCEVAEPRARTDAYCSHCHQNGDHFTDEHWLRKAQEEVA